MEGDISKCFDYIDHAILLRRLYHLGIKDRRVLQIIKQMLKAGVLDECEVNEEGTMQGGIISPLLANVYLDIMDEWVAKQWELKNTTHKYNQDSAKKGIEKDQTGAGIPSEVCRRFCNYLQIAGNMLNFGNHR